MACAAGFPVTRVASHVTFLCSAVSVRAVRPFNNKKIQTHRKLKISGYFALLISLFSSQTIEYHINTTTTNNNNNMGCLYG